MGSRKRESALARKLTNQDVVKALHNDCPSSPRKMRLVVDIIRGVEIEKALSILKYSKKDASNKLEKVLLSAMANWQSKNEGADIEEANLIVKEIFVDSARQLKRLRPAPQGRGYRIRKRSNHITLILGTKEN
ncbi:50S ribosomal protein L22 [Chryseobacterium turcicum]|uniref:Large ribosomal subunit protein uL22 n=1 Tax=Chryseobacterium turcicum TaxID=2898076 RepID=A0A9Q3V501_9FLAO|nr:50S ribosomal protein L22 [Chryseobacterium turcicum]MCD1118899.1 50S ribosomal protein L22 [Chryseobacterium turcicum]